MAGKAACWTLVILFMSCAICASVASASSWDQLGGYVAQLGKQAAHVCPEKATSLPENRNHRSGHVLVPKHAASVTLCRYFGTLELNDPHQGALIGRRVIHRSTVVGQLTRAFESLRPFPNKAIHCEIDDGAVIYATFAYKEEANVPMEISLSGCRSAYNGRLHRAFFLSSDLFNTLETLTKSR